MVEAIPLSKKSVNVLAEPHREQLASLRNSRPLSLSVARAHPVPQPDTGKNIAENHFGFPSARCRPLRTNVHLRYEPANSSQMALRRLHVTFMSLPQNLLPSV